MVRAFGAAAVGAPKPLTRADYIERIAQDIAAVVWLDHGWSGGALVWAEIRPAAKERYRTLAELIITLSDSMKVAEAMRQVVADMEAWLEGPGHATAAAPTVPDLAYDAMCRFRNSLERVRR